MKHYDVAVIGAGIVGATCALQLKKLGFNVALIDQQRVKNDIQALPETRVSAINEASYQLLQSLNVWKNLPQHRLTPILAMEIFSSSMSFPRRRESIRMSHMDPRLRGDDTEKGLRGDDTEKAEGLSAYLSFDAAEFGFSELGFILENEILLQAVLDKFKEAQGEFFCPYKIASVERQENWEIKLEKEISFTVKLLIIAQGAQSNLRELLGIKTNINFYDQKALVVNVESAEPHRFTAFQRFLATGPIAFLPLFKPNWSSIVWTLPTRLADEYLQLTANELMQKLQQVFPDLGCLQALTQVQAFELSALSAEKYSGDGLVLIGDSAHTVHPLAGQGVNMGLKDVMMLSEVLQGGVNAIDAWALARYTRNAKLRNEALSRSFSILNRLFQIEASPLTQLLNFGIDKVNGFYGLKRQLINLARGEASWI